jgi:hypothetical protein
LGLKIAERTLIAGFKAMVAQSPSAHTAVINLSRATSCTPTACSRDAGHKHVLDADSRYPKIVEGGHPRNPPAGRNGARQA